ncbi:hypothetical protein LEP1GSC185_3196 [Leptospira licerasiae serovar Varillal str. VAR 010]|uniref:Uncharacterized protein n=1 Tax=Leptospira licerasiae str. MMD4847 TaxID=1049971 RepID=A0ABN0HBE0_9LEPT|nr:hypothetical protein LEP1GSC185_3196 [Leptospira licerasiae serovar Varillal str. VAR 010]EJZ43090.1 hypothetical protein LEP1GSC178_2815 [Leptospira licerasiae str. MMD4847]
MVHCTIFYLSGAEYKVTGIEIALNRIFVDSIDFFRIVKGS